MDVGSQGRTMKPGDIVIVGSDVPLGWQDQGGAVCSVLVWVWRKAPQIGNSAPLTPQLFWKRTCSGETLTVLRGIHADTRREIALLDHFSPKLLSLLKERLDSEFARIASDAVDNRPRNELRLHLAREWMNRNVALRSPISALADYLGVSAMSLSRLFLKEMGVSPSSAFTQIKIGVCT
jgi:hypothetical protein